MYGQEQVVTSREVTVIQIPDGTPMQLPEGSQLRLMQSLGGAYTVATPWGQMLRLDAADADAIGKEPPETSGMVVDERPLEEQIWEQLRSCYDPEIPVNIVELGLVYGVNLTDHPDGGQSVLVKMTLTAPGCGMGEVLARDVKSRTEALSGVVESDVEVVFDPPWNPNMMSEAAKLQLGFL